jgi:AraC-like DNA-binding protein
MKDYAIYLPVSATSNVWQVSVTAAGYTNVRAGAAYPPGRHPLDHLFTWQRGRVLQSYQIIYIASGEGTFEAQSVGVQKVGAGTVILLFPGVWHRYQPEVKVGWVESWIEVQGLAVERLEKAGVISPERPLYRLAPPAALAEVLEQCHQVVSARPAGYSAVLGALGLQLLAWLEGVSGAARAGARSVDEAVERVQDALAIRLDRVVNMEALARELGVNYSTLRHAFKEQVGASPKQYHLQLRLRKACDLLRNTDLAVGKISEALGFASAFHLSSCFKSHVGIAPSKWRQQRMEGRVDRGP